ncbi:MAG: hypothetical protein KAS32_15225 [Candidatus Peribacteraceae bacterium]|nr:hypothetical protein [Candidatus Peribacteraceae bacterium]
MGSLGKQIAEEHAKRDIVENQKKSAADQFKARLQVIDSEIERIANILRAGYEHQEHLCVVKKDFKVGTIRVSRKDTGKEIEMKKMSELEQREFKLKMESRKDKEDGVVLEDKEIESVLEFIKEIRRASSSSIQRKFKIPFTKAARIMDVLEENKIIGAPSAGKGREILVDFDKFDISKWKKDDKK